MQSLSEIKDIFNPSTPPKSIRKLNNQFRVNCINDFLKRNVLLIKDGLLKKCLISEDITRVGKSVSYDYEVNELRS